MVLKDWKVWKKYKDGSITFVSNDQIKDMIEISKSDYPIKNEWTVYIDTQKSMGLKHYFDSKKEAIKYAKDYMKKYKD